MNNVTIFYGSRSEFEKIKPDTDCRSLTDMVMELDTDGRSFIIELPDKPTPEKKKPKVKNFVVGSNEYAGVREHVMTPHNWWPYEEVGHTQEATNELVNILGEKGLFDYPKPTRLIERILQIASDPNSIILDSFAGSGTTAHAVLNMNKADGGHRKFILVEMMDYAESITAERVKRVIDGYGQGKNAVEGTGGDFTFYDLGPVLLLPNGNLNEDVGAEKIREYVYFMETKSSIEPSKEDEPYLAG